MANKKQTAVEFLLNLVLGEDSEGNDVRLKDAITFSEINQAKEMEKQQIIDCAIETTQSCWISVMDELGEKLTFTEEDLQNQKDEAEQYYNETFNKI